MPVILNNTKRNFDAFVAGAPGCPLRRVSVKPGFNTRSDEELAILKSDPHFERACEKGALIVNAMSHEETPMEVKPTDSVPLSPMKKRAAEEGKPVEVKTKKRKRKKKKAESEFKDFD